MGLATFQGKHNANKSKTYWLLTQEYESGRWLRPSEIHDILGVPLRSLLTSLPRWCRWHRLSRRKRNWLFGIQNNTEGHTVVSRVGLAYAIVTIYGRDSRMARETQIIFVK
jgi:hypothetical protein